MFGFFSSSKPAEPEPAQCAPKNLNPDGIKPYFFSHFLRLCTPIIIPRCCACPETKSARDACFFNTDPNEADDKCKALVKAHVACMASYGFKV